jgi:hypothetical protein
MGGDGLIMDDLGIRYLSHWTCVEIKDTEGSTSGSFLK